MDKRCRMLPETEQKACQVLQPLSIIDSYFTRQETAFFLDSLQITEEEKNYIAEEYLEIAEEQAFISGEENYYFSNEKIKKYFKSLIAKKERLHHKKFANYLQIYHPEDYYNRGKHLSFSLLKNEFKSVIESWQLLFLAYIRRTSEIGDFSDIYHILDDINNLIHQLKPELETAQIDTLNALINGYKLLMLSWVVMISPCHAVMRLPGYLSWNVPFDGAAVRPITKGISSYIHALPAL